MRYYRAKVAEDEEQFAYRLYVTETLRLQGEGQYIAKSWLDLISPKPTDTRNAVEIAEDFVQKHGLKFAV